MRCSVTAAWLLVASAFGTANAAPLGAMTQQQSDFSFDATDVKRVQGFYSMPLDPTEQAKWAEEQRRKQRLEQTTEYLLGNSYVNYIRLKKCYDVRAGYATVFVSDAELEQARLAVKQIEDKLAASDLGNDRSGKPWTIEKMWTEANQIVSRDGTLSRHICQTQYKVLMQRYRTLFPDAGQVRKDF